MTLPTFRKVPGATRLTGSAYSISRIAALAAQEGRDTLTANFGTECESLELDDRLIPVTGDWLVNVDDRFVYMDRERFSEIYPEKVYLTERGEDAPGIYRIDPRSWRGRENELHGLFSYEEPDSPNVPFGMAPLKSPERSREEGLSCRGARTRPVPVSINKDAVKVCPPALDGVGSVVRLLGPYHGRVTINLAAYREKNSQPRLTCGRSNPIGVYEDSVVLLPGCCYGSTPAATFRTKWGLEAMRVNRGLNPRSPVGFNIMPWLRKHGLTLVKIGGFTYIARRGTSRPILWRRVTADSWVVVPKKDSAGTFIVSGDKCAERIFA